jgi:hypothetical protein
MRFFNLFFLAVLVFGTTVLGYAQAPTEQGDPLVNSSSGGTISQATSKMVVDVTQFGGTDVCADISSALLAMPGTGNPGGEWVLDARAAVNTTGVNTHYLTCQGNPFASSSGGPINKSFKLLLGGKTYIILEHLQTKGFGLTVFGRTRYTG